MVVYPLSHQRIARTSAALARSFVKEKETVFGFSFLSGSKDFWKSRNFYRCFSAGGNPLWFGLIKNRDASIRLFALPFARSLTPLAHSLAPQCLLCSGAPLRSSAPLRSFVH